MPGFNIKGGIPDADVILCRNKMPPLIKTFCRLGHKLLILQILLYVHLMIDSYYYAKNPS